MNLFMATATAAVMVATIAAPIPADAAAKSFKDIPKSHAYYKEITEMAKQGIISGYEDGTFKPNQQISRKHASALISRATPDLPTGKALKFKDIKDTNPYLKDITKLINNKLLIPKTVNGVITFEPDKPLTRGEMAKILYEAYDLKELGYDTNRNVFKDKGILQYQREANALHNAGITTGYEDGTFRENETLSRAHYAVFMYRAAKVIKTGGNEKPVTPPKPPTDTNDESYWTTPPKLESQAAMDKADADNTLKGGRESNGNSYGGLSKFSRISMRNMDNSSIKLKMEMLGVNPKEFKELAQRADKGEFVTGTDSKGEPYYLYYNFKEDRYYLGA